MLRDFFEFVDRHHPSLGPNRRLRVCGSDKDRLLSRLRAILEDAIAHEAWVEDEHAWSAAWIPGAVVGSVFLGVRDEPQPHVFVALYPANTLTGARVLYAKRPDRARAVVELEAAGWDLSSAFHMGFIQENVAYDEWGFCDAARYVEYWLRQIGDARQRPRAEWIELAREMAADGIASEDYAARIEALPAHMDRVSPKPTMELVYNWPLDQAKRLDDDENQFMFAVRIKLTEALAATGDPIPEMS